MDSITFIIFLYLASRFANGYGLLESIAPTNLFGFLICCYLGFLLYMCYTPKKDRATPENIEAKKKEKEEWFKYVLEDGSYFREKAIMEEAKRKDMSNYTRNLGLGTYVEWTKEANAIGYRDGRYFCKAYWICENAFKKGKKLTEEEKELAIKNYKAYKEVKYKSKSHASNMKTLEKQFAKVNIKIDEI